MTSNSVEGNSSQQAWTSPYASKPMEEGNSVCTIWSGANSPQSFRRNSLTNTQASQQSHLKMPRVLFRADRDMKSMNTLSGWTGAQSASPECFPQSSDDSEMRPTGLTMPRVLQTKKRHMRLLHLSEWEKRLQFSPPLRIPRRILEDAPSLSAKSDYSDRSCSESDSSACDLCGDINSIQLKQKVRGICIEKDQEYDDQDRDQDDCPCFDVYPETSALPQTPQVSPPAPSSCRKSSAKVNSYVTFEDSAEASAPRDKLSTQSASHRHCSECSQSADSDSLSPRLRFLASPLAHSEGISLLYSLSPKMFGSPMSSSLNWSCSSPFGAGASLISPLATLCCPLATASHPIC